MSSRLTLAILLVCFLTLGLCASSLADSRKPPGEQTEFESMIARIRAAAASKEWQKEGWTDEKTETQLSQLLAAINAATGKQRQLPITFKDVTAKAGPRPNPLQGGFLRVFGQNAHLSFTNKSIFLVDGSINIAHCSDCLIIARGAVEIAHGNRNLIIAGHHVNISHDGSDGFRGGGRPGAAAPALADGSLVFCGGTIEISHAHGTICSAPAEISISHATQVDFLACPNIKKGHQTACTDHKAFVSPLAIPTPQKFPASVFKITQIVAGDEPARQLLTVQGKNIEYVLRPGSKITDEQGQPLPDWANWKLDFLSYGFALFTDGQTDASIHLPE